MHHIRLTVPLLKLRNIGYTLGDIHQFSNLVTTMIKAFIKIYFKMREHLLIDSKEGTCLFVHRVLPENAKANISHVANSS